jgi:primosomal protein N' (replication factor Y) (superfamily II helicase)
MPSLHPPKTSQMQPGIVQVLLPLALPRAYSYLVPHGMALDCGDYVRVPLGPREVIGVVWGAAGLPDDTVDPAKLREVSVKFDSPAMSAEQREFFDWITEYTLSPPGLVLRMGLRVSAALGPARQEVGYAATGDNPEKMTAQRARVLEIVTDGGVWKAGELARAAGVSTGVVKGLVEAGGLAARQLPAFLPFDRPDIKARVPNLSTEQAAAADVLRKQVKKAGFSAVLLDGVTGSGKTLVYLEAIAATIALGQQVLVLLPEIALTSQFLETFEQRFDAAPAPWHSALRPRERERVWRAVARGQAKIIVGARSALFLPFQDAHSG